MSPGDAVSAGAWLALDVGGANLKYGVAADRDAPRVLTSGTLPFPLWREPEALSERLRELELRAHAGAPAPPWPADGGPSRVALTLTAELADCFPTRPEGVRRVLDAVTGCWKAADVRVWSSEGGWRSPGEARAEPMDVAAANWRAPTEWLARAGRHVLLADMGSTTIDLVPVRAGAGSVGPSPRTDLERLRAGELVYTGLLRTPVCALVDEVELPSGPVPVAAEVFAVAADVHLWLGDLDPEGYLCEPPDGGARTRAGAGRRLARMLCSDPDEAGPEAIRTLAEQAADGQVRRLLRALRRQRKRLGHAFPPAAVCTGAGARVLQGWLRRAGLEVERPPGPLAEEHAPAATACTLALLALEDHREGGGA